MDQQAKDEMKRGSLLELNMYFISYFMFLIEPFNTLYLYATFQVQVFPY